MIFFITGIDTEIGKTQTTGLLARHFLQRQKTVITQKLAQTGQNNAATCNGICKVSEDIAEHRRLMGVSALPEDRPLGDRDGTLTCPYSFAYPASPHLAARLEQQEIDPARLDQSTAILRERYDVVLLEGAGGFLVPLTPDFLQADYIAQRRYPVILVTSGRLGSINHTILTIEAIRRRDLPLACLVFNRHTPNQRADQDDVISNDSLTLFRRLCPDVVIVPRMIQDQMIQDQVPDVDFSCLDCWENI